MRKLVVPAVVGAVVSGVVLASPAQALENPVDVTSVKPPAKVVVNSTACRNIAVTYGTAVDPGWEFWGAQVDVKRNGVQHDTEFLNVPVSGGTVLDTYFYCPWLDGLGTFTFGGSFVTGWSDALSTSQEFEDVTSRSVKVAVATKASIAGTRSGSKVAFTVKTRRFVLSANAFRPWSSSKVIIQKKRADGTWANFKTIRYTSTGTAKATLTAGRGTYRAVAPGNSWIWQPTSGAITR